MKTLRNTLLGLISLLALVPARAADDVPELTINGIPSILLHSNVPYGNRGFLDTDVDSIVFSRRYPNGDEYSHPVMQYIFTPDSLYAYDMHEVDSISFQIPKPIPREGTVIIDEAYSDYIVDVDSAYFVLDPKTPSRFVPEEGQMVFSEIYEGVRGKVLGIEDCPLGKKVNLKYGYLAGSFFEQYYRVGRTEEYQTPEGVKARIKLSSRPGKSPMSRSGISFDDVPIFSKLDLNVGKLLSKGGQTFDFFMDGASFGVNLVGILGASGHYSSALMVNVSLPEYENANGLFNFAYRELFVKYRLISTFGLSLSAGKTVNFPWSLIPLDAGHYTLMGGNSSWYEFSADYSDQISAGADLSLDYSHFSPWTVYSCTYKEVPEGEGKTKFMDMEWKKSTEGESHNVVSLAGQYTSKFAFKIYMVAPSFGFDKRLVSIIDIKTEVDHKRTISTSAGFGEEAKYNPAVYYEKELLLDDRYIGFTEN